MANWTPLCAQWIPWPRVVVGVGHQIEIGMNFDGLRAPALDQLEISPTVKWRLWNGRTSRWRFYVGDDLFFPVRKRTYEAGNYIYAFFAKEWKHNTRIGIGGYDFTRNVVADANRAGGQFTFRAASEQSLDVCGGVVHRQYCRKLCEPWRDPETQLKTHTVRSLSDRKRRRNDEQSPVPLGNWLQFQLVARIPSRSGELKTNLNPT